MEMEHMIKGAWRTTRLLCANHGEDAEPVELGIQQGPVSLFYACPKYHPENRQPGENPCLNRISLLEFEGMLAELSKILGKAEEDSRVENLTNHSFSRRGIEYRVVSHTKEEMVVSVLNRKALARKR